MFADRRMIFTYYDERLNAVPFICVDGVGEGGVNVSHWPGHRTPAHLKAGTSTEIALGVGRDPERYQIIYDRLLSSLPDLLTGAAARKELWGDRLQATMRSMMRIGDVARVREHDASRLTVIEATEPLDEMARFNVARHHRVLTATRSAGGFVYEMAFQIFSWFETVTPPRGTRFDLTEVGARLDHMETAGGGRWTYTGDDSLESRLYRAGPDGSPVASTLPLESLESLLMGVFEARP